jgi:hypothetical protein
MRVFIPIVCLVAVAIVLFIGITNWVSTSRAPVIHSQGPTVESLKRLSALATLRVTISDVLQAESTFHRGAFLVQGDATLAVDLSQASFPADSRDVANHKVRVILPPPHVLSARVDHERTLTWDVQQRIWVISSLLENSDALRDDAMRQAQRLIQHAANSKENIELARTHAVEVIRNLYREVGWDVEILWTDQASATAIPATVAK